jgi:CBS domain containing-hemolysin-like protein
VSSGTAIKLAGLVLLLLLSAFFSSAETALTTVNRIRILNLAQAGDPRARTALKVLDQQSKMLSCILIGNNLVNISASSLATALTIQLFGSSSIGLMTGLLTLVVLIFGEITPKNAANVSSEKLTLRYARIIRLLMIIFTPLIFLVNLLSSGMMTLLRIPKDGGDSTITEDEIRTMVNVSHKDGETTSEEKEMINNVYDFGDQCARDICVPRADIVSVSIDDSYETVQEVYRNEHFTRLPVYEKERDHIVGILNIKDFCFVEDREHFTPKDLMYEPYYTFETKKVSELMVEMRDHSSTVTIVLDEYGSAVGMITFEDLIEEVVGEIRDEYDEDEKDLIRRVSDRQYLVAGSVKLDDLNDATNLDLHSDDYDSIGGYLIEQLGHLAARGDKVVTPDRLLMIADKVKGNRILKVRIVLPERSEKPETE